jgi:hypothetical protein
MCKQSKKTLEKARETNGDASFGWRFALGCVCSFSTRTPDPHNKARAPPSSSSTTTTYRTNARDDWIRFISSRI